MVMQRSQRDRPPVKKAQKRNSYILRANQSMTLCAREKLYQLFNYSYKAELPTVITTSDSRDEMDPRIRSRLLDGKLCSIYAITVPGYHGNRGKKVKK
jgi:DNA replication protein DnaC